VAAIKRSFNPTVVRLGPALQPLIVPYIQMFQSHCGAIRTSEYEFLRRAILKFQSHCGAIRTCCSQAGRLEFHTRFQSHCGAIRTRQSVRARRRPSQFQSHCGAIRTTRTSGARQARSAFQSHCGAIRTSLLCSVERSEQSVSIPLWCD